MQATLIGIDSATLDKKMGLALAQYHSETVLVQDVTLGTGEGTAAKIVGGWVSDASEPVLLCIDAPLGWPDAMGPTLAAHRAGQAITVASNTLFKWETDRYVYRHTGKTPLDVGADRIARTAVAALKLLNLLGDHLGRQVPLVWSPQHLAGVGAIEVYPAATLTTHRVQADGYKARSQLAARAEILDAIEGERGLVVNVPRNKVIESADILDALVCVVAAMDFLRGLAMHPDDLALAEREGWIWVRAPPTAASKGS